jgi:hypothetical protein
MQYLEALAPADHDGDGVKDLLTPNQYLRPSGENQTLLSTAKSTYQVLSGADGRLLHTETVWGSNSLALGCRASANELTVLSGHARRLDLIRLDVKTGEEVWRQPVYNDARIQSASYGADLIGLHVRCTEGEGEDNRTFFAINMFRISPDRGFEVQPIFGYVWGNGTIAWVAPSLNPDPGILNFLDLLPKAPPVATATENAVVTLGPVLLGLATGSGLGLLRRFTKKVN